MKVDNTTHYSTRQIRTVLTKVHNHMAKAEGRMRRWKVFRIRIGKTRTARTSGYAWVNNANTGPMYMRTRATHGYLGTAEALADVVLRLPTQGATERELGWLAYHEFMHSYGYAHSQYSDIPKAELEALFPDNRALELK